MFSSIFANTTRLLEKGAHIKAIQELLGHSIIGTTGISVGQTLGRRIETVFVYDVYEPPVNFSDHTTSGSTEVWISNTFKSLKDGTRVDHGLKLKLSSLMKLAEPIIAMSMKQQAHLFPPYSIRQPSSLFS